MEPLKVQVELTTPDCPELLDRALTAEQELGSLLRDLAAFEKRLRTVEEGGPVAFRAAIADELHEILHPSI